MEWIDLAQERDRWSTCNAVIIFGSHKMRGITLLAETRLASQEGLCSMEQVSVLRLSV